MKYTDLEGNVNVRQNSVYFLLCDFENIRPHAADYLRTLCQGI